MWREGVERPRFDPAEAKLILRFATLAALAYANAQQRERLPEQALTDALTGLANRRHFRERLLAEVARTAREDRTMSLVLFDVDDFKAINDRHGHPGRRRCPVRVRPDPPRRGAGVRRRLPHRRRGVRGDPPEHDDGRRRPLRRPGPARQPDEPAAFRRPPAHGVGRHREHGDGPAGDDLLRVADNRLLAAKAAAGNDRVETCFAPVA